MRAVSWLVVTMVFAAACSSSGSSSAGGPVSQQPGASLRLYTHCGIDGFKLGSKFYALTPRQAANVKVPIGWGNPFEDGRVRVGSGGVAVFTSKGRDFRFRISTRKTLRPCY